MEICYSIADGTCRCTIGYACDCNGLTDYFPKARKRPYTYNGSLAEKKPISKLMKKRLDDPCASQNIVEYINKGCCKSMQCLSTMFRGSAPTVSETQFSAVNRVPSNGHGDLFLRSVVAARSAVYRKDQNKAKMNLKNLLLRCSSTTKIDCMQYKFFHQGLLGNSPDVPVGIIVSMTM